jgi:glycosyltransferase involved in cell wall biosynthesis
MRIAWFTPFSTRSAIGEFSRHITDVLSEHAEVEIWTHDTPPLHHTDLPVVGFSPESPDLELLGQREMIVYNMGDHLPFHAHINAISQRYPGIVILHDRVLHHLFAGLWLMASEPARQTYVERMETFYGPHGGEIAKASLLGERRPVWESDEEVLEYPLYEEALVHALGTVTHSEDQARDVRGRWFGPVRSLHLPCYAEVLRSAEALSTAEARPDARVRLLSIGHVNPNKQIHRIVEFLAADPELAAHVHYTIVGPSDDFQAYVADLGRLVERNRDTLSVEILGWREDRELERLMAQTDIFVNLRHPVMEGGSASLMRQLAFGRPVVCFDEGLFGELPPEAAVQVPAGDFVAAAAALRELVFDGDRRRRIGAAGRAVAESYSERRYADELLEFIEETRRAAPALRFIDRVAVELGHMGVDGRLPIFDRINDDFSRFLWPSESREESAVAEGIV